MTALTSTATIASGWYRVCALHDLNRLHNQVLDVTWLGREVAVYLDDEGEPQVVQRFCPHLGASFAVGGRVEGDELVCPFHGWRFEARSGRLAQVPYSGRKPPRACLKRWPAARRGGHVVAWHDGGIGDTPTVASESRTRNPLPPFPVGWYALCFSADLPVGEHLHTRWLGLDVTLRREADGGLHARVDDGRSLELDEQQGAILGWYHPANASPPWRVPTPDAAGWTGYEGHVWRDLDSHPQETSENSVDVAHFAAIHRYDQVETLREAETDGHLLKAEYAFVRPIVRGGPKGLVAKTEFRVDVHGLGFSFVETRVRNLGVRTRQLVMATPTDGRHIDLRISAAVEGLTVLGPLAPLARLAARRGLMRAYMADVADDFDVWQHKRYLARPLVVDGDGPIHRYRQWARQFYVDEGSATSQRIAS